MKHLRQYIRQILLTEGAAQPTDLPDHVVVVIKQTAPTYFMIYYGDKDSPEKAAATAKIRGAPWMGKVTMGKPYPDHGNCGGALKVGNANALSGWGPMLYDVAMEHATEIANGLFPDRASVSMDANDVWKYYLRNRDDVTAHQMDDPYNRLTPEDEDNCNQDVAMKDEDAYDWQESPLSKRYTKGPTTINALKAAGKLVML